MGDCLREKVLKRLEERKGVASTVIENYFLRTPVPNPDIDYDGQLHDTLKITTSYGNGLSPGNDVVVIEFDLRGAQAAHRALCDEVLDLFFECAPDTFTMMLNKLDERYDAIFQYEANFQPQNQQRIRKAEYVRKQVANLKWRFESRRRNFIPIPVKKYVEAFPQFKEEEAKSNSMVAWFV